MGSVFRTVTHVVEITALLATICLSLTVAIVMGLLKADYKGGCPLYPTVTLFLIRLNDESNCNYVIGMHSVAIFIAVFAAVYRVMELIKQKELISSTVVPVFFVVLYLLVAILILVTACVVTVGFSQLCRRLVGRNVPFFNKCIHYQKPHMMPPFDSTHFHDYLVTAESTTWLSFGSWLFLAVLTVVLQVCCNN